jgi:hypothetical protein
VVEGQAGRVLKPPAAPRTGAFILQRIPGTRGRRRGLIVAGCVDDVLVDGMACASINPASDRRGRRVPQRAPGFRPPPSSFAPLSCFSLVLFRSLTLPSGFQCLTQPTLSPRLIQTPRGRALASARHRPRTLRDLPSLRDHPTATSASLRRPNSGAPRSRAGTSGGLSTLTVPAPPAYASAQADGPRYELLNATNHLMFECDLFNNDRSSDLQYACISELTAVCLMLFTLIGPFRPRWAPPSTLSVLSSTSSNLYISL